VSKVGRGAGPGPGDRARRCGCRARGPRGAPRRRRYWPLTFPPWLMGGRKRAVFNRGGPDEGDATRRADRRIDDDVAGYDPPKSPVSTVAPGCPDLMIRSTACSSRISRPSATARARESAPSTIHPQICQGWGGRHRHMDSPASCTGLPRRARRPWRAAGGSRGTVQASIARHAWERRRPGPRESVARFSLSSPESSLPAATIVLRRKRGGV